MAGIDRTRVDADIADNPIDKTTSGTVLSKMNQKN